MSKNGKLLFRGYDPYITSSFDYQVHSITGKQTLHAGVDYGTNEKKLPTYAIEDGIVVKIGFFVTLGNYVYVKYPRLGKTGLYQHLDRVVVKVNQKVDKDTIIGYVGNTGEAIGIHLHFGWFNSLEQDKDWYSKNWEDFEKYNYIPKLSILGNPVLKNENIDQIEVIIPNLRVRKVPNGEILGYIKPGIYNILNRKIETDYTWYMIDDNMWIAYSSKFANLYLKKIEVEVISKKDEIDITDIEDEDNTTIEESIIVKKDSIFKRIGEFIKKILKKINIL